MRRGYIAAAAILALCISLLFAGLTAAQERLAQGDPPNIAQIAVSAPDASGQITITGDSNAVFPGAYI
ncbi:MAG: hypothetical protein IAE89_06460, partial [Anaerolineae bacterium]|nr:hypothetical protein [Anaerolineae bacterium]